MITPLAFTNRLHLLVLYLLAVSAVSAAFDLAYAVDPRSLTFPGLAAKTTTSKKTTSSSTVHTSSTHTSSTIHTSSTLRSSSTSIPKTTSSSVHTTSSTARITTSSTGRTTSATPSTSSHSSSSSLTSQKSTSTSRAITSSAVNSTSKTLSSSSVVKSTSTSASNLTSTTTIPAPVPLQTTTNQSPVGQAVFAHFIVGNVYNYSVSNWLQDITLATSKGIDGFALNVGSDTWEPARVADAYTAAAASGTGFKLFLSFDMSSLPCTSASNIQLLQTYINTYAQHPNQYLVNNQTFISTFSGEGCTFGASTVNQGWINTVKTNVPATYFVPSFFIDPATFSSYTVMDGAFNWNGGWPMTDSDISFTSDAYYLSYLSGRSYMGAVSPWFFTHYGPDTYNKNFIYRADDWLFAERWEMLIENRNTVNFTEALTWNDFGESHYLGPIEGIQPMSQAWVNGFDHQAWLDLMQYYITAYKTGVYPTISTDRIFLWARLYPKNATSPDTVPIPTNWQWTDDYLWAAVQATAPANVTLACGNSTSSTPIPSGLSKLKLPLFSNCSVNATLTRNAQTVVNFAPSGFTFSTTPPSYNFNAFVAASP